jgi:hypothetical protein
MIKEGEIDYSVVNTELTQKDREEIQVWIQRRKAHRSKHQNVKLPKKLKI